MLLRVIFMGLRRGQRGTQRIVKSRGSRNRIVPSHALTLIWISLLASLAVAQSPNLADLSSQGKAALASEQFDRAQKIYEQIVKLDPRSAEAHSNLGFSFSMLGSYSSAIGEFRK